MTYPKYFFEKGGFKMDISMKSGAEKKPFRILNPPKKAVIFMQQHIGKCNEPLVKKGERVLTGQKIGDAEGTMTVPVHSSVTGIVEEITEIYHPVLNRMETAVVVKREGREEMKPLPSVDLNHRKDIIELVREAGIVGMGGAAFPTHVKLASKGVDTLIVNAKESDPNLVCDVRLMIEKPAEIVRGIKLMAKALGTKRTVFATRTREGEIPELEKQLKASNMEVERVTPSYSVGSEKLLVKELLGKEVPWGKFPPDIGVVVNNVSTAYAVYRAAYLGEPSISRGISFYTHKRGVDNLWFRAGTTVKEVMNCMDEMIPGYDRYVLGSLMMGWATKDVRTPLLKYTAGLTAFSKDRYKPYDKQLECIRCGYCDTVCPVDIYPSLIMKANKESDVKALKRLHVEDCILCNLCSFVCPSHIRLTDHLFHGKDRLNDAD